ncbi:ABC transporter substrate-binding protein [Nonomuraea sp. NPDC050556]|uniref:ABC transporter substrate-binding protein n=1 Tax=Nonomuraea sp. NPDC050556 TaxID=3364369 RepID=UPI0037BE1CB9
MKTKIAGLLATALLLTACSSGEPTTSATPSYVVKIDVHGWTGYEAAAAVVTYLLEHELGYKVERRKTTEDKSWPDFETGKVDVILENWGHPAEKKEFIEKKKVALSAGLLGSKGIIGWYVPKWMTQKYPGITNWRNLNKYAHLFRTKESGDKGQLLDGDPSYVTNDVALVKNLNLDFKVVVGGSEAALLKSAIQAQEQKQPLLFYFWDPHWAYNKLELTRITLPPYAIGCDDDAAKVACDYPPYLLDKIVSTRFAKDGGKAYELIRNFNWTNDQQNAVAADIVNGKMTADEAAKKWIDENKIVWKDWIPR